jgi:HAD superfamily hydrolase (TIGR01509 family)
MAPFGVVFDADGVLLDSERQSLEALRLAIEKVTNGKVAWTADLFDFVCGRGDDPIAVRLNQDYGLSIDLAHFRKIKLDCYRNVIAANPIRIAPGTIELLDDLAAASIPYAIATGAIRAKLDMSLKALGLTDRFFIITSADDVAVGKPDPAIFRVCAKRLGMTPNRIVVFEDSINGIVAANRAGMFSVAVVGTFSREQLSQARRVVGDLRQVTVADLHQWLDGPRQSFSETGGGSCARS